MSTIAASAAATPVQAAASPASGATNTQAPAPKKHHGFGFADLIDIINPLQHIPIISTIYRRLTGDEIGSVAKVAGGALYGGLIGLGLSVADVAVEEVTGEDTGDHVMDMLGIKSHEDKPTAVASAPSDSASAQAVPLPVIAPATSEADARTWFPAHPAGSARTAALSGKAVSETKGAPEAAAAVQAQAAAAGQASPEGKALEAAPSATTLTNAKAAPALSATMDGAPAAPDAPRAATAKPAAGSVPQMDQATFDALMRTLNNGKSIATAEASGSGVPDRKKKDQAHPADLTPAPSTASAQSSAAPVQAAKGYDNALKAMSAALDRYQAAGGRIPPTVTVPRFVPSAH